MSRSKPKPKGLLHTVVALWYLSIPEGTLCSWIHAHKPLTIRHALALHFFPIPDSKSGSKRTGDPALNSGWASGDMMLISRWISPSPSLSAFCFTLLSSASTQKGNSCVPPLLSSHVLPPQRAGALPVSFCNKNRSHPPGVPSKPKLKA